VWYISIKTRSNYRYIIWFLFQARFVLDNSSSDTLWYIPVSYTTQEETKDATNIRRKTFPRIWLKQELTITILNLTQPKSFKQWVFLTYRLQVCEVKNISCDDKEYADSDNNSWILCFSQTLGFRYQLVVPDFQSDSRPSVVLTARISAAIFKRIKFAYIY